MRTEFDFIIIGAGIVGAATALKLSERYPNRTILVLEKEKECASHQTGRNSGVIHAGVYYKAGSLKAKYCRQGLEQTVSFCQQHRVPYQQCGKLIVATTNDELERLSILQQQCEMNSLSPDLLDQKQLKREQPYIKGVSALKVAQSGITDYVAITQKLLSLSQANGVEIRYHSLVNSITEQSSGVTIAINNTKRLLKAEFLINCAGVHADTLIKTQGVSCDFSIIPFKGEYFRLSDRCSSLTNQLIYPVPDPTLPFLGVHLTPMIGGYLTVGPNAVLSFGKEAYDKQSIDISDTLRVLSSRAFWKMSKRYWLSGLSEFKDSLSMRGYLKRIRQYCEHIELQDLLPYRSGIRAQAVDNDGVLIHDFRFVETTRALHIGNAPSPAATSALPIAEAIVNKIG